MWTIFQEYIFVEVSSGSSNMEMTIRYNDETG